MQRVLAKQSWQIDLERPYNMVNLYTTNRVQPPIHVLYQIAEILNEDVRSLLIPNELKK